MNAVLTFLTNKSTTLVAVISGVVLLFADDLFVAELQNFGLSATFVAKLVSATKILSYVLAGLGYSPLARPKAEPTTPDA